MESNDFVHQDVVLVTDKALAAVLFMLEHRAIAMYQNEGDKKFCCVFKITKRLREDVRHYYGPGHAFNIKMFQDEIEGIDLELELYRHRVADAVNAERV